MKTFYRFIICSFVWVLTFSSCHKDTHKDCGCDSTIIKSVTTQSAVLYAIKVDGKTQWNLAVSQPEQDIRYYTGVICNSEAVEEMLAKENLELKPGVSTDQVAVIFSGDLFNRCVVDDPDVQEFTVNYSFNVHLESISLNTNSDN